jgi:glycogen synthase
VNTVLRPLKSSLALKGSTVHLILPIYPQGLEREFRIRHVVVGVKGPTTVSDTTLALRLSDAETNYVYKV